MPLEMSAAPPGPRYVNQCIQKTAAAAQPCNIQTERQVTFIAFFFTVTKVNDIIL